MKGVCVVQNQQLTREEPTGDYVYAGRIDASCRARHRSREHRGILVTLASGGAVTHSPPPHPSIEVPMGCVGCLSLPPLRRTTHRRRRQERCRCTAAHRRRDTTLLGNALLSRDVKIRRHHSIVTSEFRLKIALLNREGHT
jgi:hypothetical protein